MSDNFIRHLIAIISTIIAFIIFVIGYSAGTAGWWWAGIMVLGVYVIVHKLVDV
ncbi:MAG: hypothetical protein GW939_03400 [Candidatus Magasanikbacteria bacterium]|nr:hypothetical protein [Candidatus Magasanikbacteria bacterium]NCS71665.1 hypothetical protein [Candidatus Magasanikbacteria bacterium]